VYELYKIYRDRSKRGDGEGTRHGAEVGLGTWGDQDGCGGL
jgi:hypothetical protein